MPQLQLPFFPEGVTRITDELAFMKQDGKVTCLNGHMPIFIHDEDDIPTFRMITAQFCINGNAKQMDIVRAFGVTSISVKRAVKRYRQYGPAGFYGKPRRRGAAVLTAKVIREAQEMLDEGREIPEIAEKLELKANTPAKAAGDGRLHQVKKKALIGF